ncbi:teiresias [Carabus blaptoides fortunei]
MKSMSLEIPWIGTVAIVVLTLSVPLLDIVDAKSHIRHLHNNNNNNNNNGRATYQRSTRADKVSSGSSTKRVVTSNGGGGGGEDVSLVVTTAMQVYSNQHEQLTLQCDVNINFTTSIWLKDGQIVQTVLIDNSKRASGHRFLVDNAGDLLVDTVRLEDDGRWQCEAEDAQGFVVAARPIHLTVLDPPKKPYLLIDNRILDPGNLFIPVKENSELTVSCVVDGGNPKPTLTWDLSLGSLALLDAPEIPYQALNLTEVPREQSAGARSEAHLDRVLRAHHNATISCVVHHMTLKSSLNVSLLLDVQYTPSFAISREPGFGFPIREGMPVSLKCEVDSNPRSAPVWQKDDTSPPVQQTPDGFLNFTAIRREHSGWYKCVSRHLLGRFSSIGYFLNVRYEPGDVTPEPDFDVGELSSTGRQVEVALGGAVQLQCPAGSIGCWTRLNSDTGGLDPIGASQDLKLEQIVYQEAGEYKCIAPTQDTDKKKKLDSLRNSYSVQVLVKGKPVVYPNNQTVTAVNGQELVLTVEFCANPVYNKVIWITSTSRVVRPGEVYDTMYAHEITNTTAPNCHNAALTLKTVSVSDSGEYGFLVRSPNGLTEGIFNVNVTQASEYTNNKAGPQCCHTIHATIYIMYVIQYYYFND